MSTITAANSILMLSVVGLFPIPQKIEGYAADDAFSSDEIDIAEAVIGVDGKASFGYVPNLKPFKIMLQADSPSLPIYDAILAATHAGREVYIVNQTVTLPAIGKKYAFTRGTITKAQAIPGVKKTLQPVGYTLMFERCESSAA